MDQIPEEQVLRRCERRRPTGGDPRPHRRLWAERIELRQEGRIARQHARAFGRGGTPSAPLALRAVAGAQARRPAQWRPARRLGAAGLDPEHPAQAEGGAGRRPADGADPRRGADRRAAGRFAAACAEALEQGVRSADVVLNILARSRDTGPPPTIATPEALRLNREPVADCARYDSLRGAR